MNPSVPATSNGGAVNLPSPAILVNPTVKSESLALLRSPPPRRVQGLDAAVAAGTVAPMVKSCAVPPPACVAGVASTPPALTSALVSPPPKSSVALPAAKAAAPCAAKSAVETPDATASKKAKMSAPAIPLRCQVPHRRAVVETPMMRDS